MHSEVSNHLHRGPTSSDGDEGQSLAVSTRIDDTPVTSLIAAGVESKYLTTEATQILAMLALSTSGGLRKQGVARTTTGAPGYNIIKQEEKGSCPVLNFFETNDGHRSYGKYQSLVSTP
jgi:hypothetical protein